MTTWQTEDKRFEFETSEIVLAGKAQERPEQLSFWTAVLYQRNPGASSVFYRVTGYGPDEKSAVAAAYAAHEDSKGAYSI